jgi:hypothetical protein
MSSICPIGRAAHAWLPRCAPDADVTALAWTPDLSAVGVLAMSPSGTGARSASPDSVRRRWRPPTGCRVRSTSTSTGARGGQKCRHDRSGSRSLVTSGEADDHALADHSPALRRIHQFLGHRPRPPVSIGLLAYFVRGAAPTKSVVPPAPTGAPPSPADARPIVTMWPMSARGHECQRSHTRATR